MIDPDLDSTLRGWHNLVETSFTPMKSFFRATLMIAGLVGLLIAAGLLISLVSPTPVIRRVVRENPLKHPLQVTRVSGLTIIADGQSYIIGGVKLPSGKVQVDLLTEFVQVATAQGIELDESADLPSGQSIRCEPRIWHWCGVDPIAAHFQQMNLNELIVALGYGELAAEMERETSPAALRLRAAARYATERRPHADRQTTFTHGIDITDITGVDSGIASYAYEIESEQK